MKTGMTPRTQVIALAAVILIVSAGFAYLYFSTQSEISSFSTENQTLCSQLYSLVGSTQKFYDNLSVILRGWIQNDNSLIQAINSSKPADYAEMISLLRVQVDVSSLVLSAASTPVSVGENSCAG